MSFLHYLFQVVLGMWPLLWVGYLLVRKGVRMAIGPKPEFTGQVGDPRVSHDVFCIALVLLGAACFFVSFKIGPIVYDELLNVYSGAYAGRSE